MQQSSIDTFFGMIKLTFLFIYGAFSILLVEQDNCEIQACAECSFGECERLYLFKYSVQYGTSIVSKL